MAYFVQYDDEERCVIVRHHGAIGAAEVEHSTLRAVSLAKVHHCMGLWIDCREAVMAMSTTEIYGLPDALANRLARSGFQIHRFKRALVVPKHDEDFLFFETVSRNRAQRVRIFADPDEAKKWLRRSR